MNSSSPQPTIEERLHKTWSRKRLHQSLLFTGKKGVGKWSVAHMLTKTITCMNGEDGGCGNCDSCRQADNFTHPDIHYLFPLPKTKANELYYPYLKQKQIHPFSAGSTDVTSFITIESIREFQTKLAHKPSLSQTQVGIIYEAERMLPAAMDSLLKTLEEPSVSCYLIVVTDQPRFLPQTIHSRLLQVTFPPLSEEFVTDYLRKQEGIDQAQISFLARFAGGSLYNIEKLIEGDLFQQREKAYEMFANALKMTPPDFEVKYSSSTAIQNRENVTQLTIHWHNLLRDILTLYSVRDSEAEVDPSGSLINFDYQDKYNELQKHFSSINQLEAKINLIEEVREHLRRNVNPKMAAFNFLLNLAE